MRRVTAYRGGVTFDELMAWVRPSWMLDAACREYPEWSWHPTAGHSTKKQIAVCAACLVRAECLADALDRDERYGVWGGYDTANRLRLTPRAA